jgi:hypothetical protein
MDFDQAMVHIRGIRTLIVVRGGFSTLNTNSKLMLMISWYVLEDVVHAANSIYDKH